MGFQCNIVLNNFYSFLLQETTTEHILQETTTEHILQETTTEHIDPSKKNLLDI